MRVNYTQIQQDLTQILCVIFIFAVFPDIFDNAIRKFLRISRFFNTIFHHTFEGVLKPLPKTFFFFTYIDIP